MTFTDTDNAQATPGPVRRGLKGHKIDTYIVGEGLTALWAKNPSSARDVVLEVTFAAKARPNSATPGFWAD